MKVIFLDVDGVLNNADWSVRMMKEEGINTYSEDLLYEKSLRCLAQIVKATDAKIVVSSTWRFDRTAMSHLQEQLEAHGMEIYDVTPHIGIRGQDIDIWLMDHDDVDGFVILDDDTDMEPNAGHLVQTTWEHGLCSEHIDLAINVINGGR